MNFLLGINNVHLYSFTCYELEVVKGKLAGKGKLPLFELPFIVK